MRVASAACDPVLIRVTAVVAWAARSRNFSKLADSGDPSQMTTRGEAVVIGGGGASPEGDGPLVGGEEVSEVAHPRHCVVGDLVPGWDGGDVVVAVDRGSHVADGDDGNGPEGAVGELEDQRSGEIRAGGGLTGDRQDAFCFQVEVNLPGGLGAAETHETRCAPRAYPSSP